jgi:hypothetical protein
VRVPEELRVARARTAHVMAHGKDIQSHTSDDAHTRGDVVEHREIAFSTFMVNFFPEDFDSAIIYT